MFFYVKMIKQSDGSDKFYEIITDPSDDYNVVVTWGKTGRPGMSQVKTGYVSAERYIRSLIDSKKKKGYKIVTTCQTRVPNSEEVVFYKKLQFLIRRIRTKHPKLETKQIREDLIWIQHMKQMFSMDRKTIKEENFKYMNKLWKRLQ